MLELWDVVGQRRDGGSLATNRVRSRNTRGANLSRLGTTATGLGVSTRRLTMNGWIADSYWVLRERFQTPEMEDCGGANAASGGG